MALLNAFHFDANIIPSELVNTGGSAPTNSRSRTGTYSCRVSYVAANFGTNLRYALPTPISEFFVQFSFNASALGTTYSQIFRWEAADGTVLGGIKINTTSWKLEAYTGNFVTLVGTGTTVLQINTLYLIEVHVVIGDSGTIEVRVDLNQEITFSGDTKPDANTTVGFIKWGGVNGNYWYMDDVIIHDAAGSVNNSWPNGAKVYYMVPTGDGATKEWAPSAGSDHYALVDEVPPSATDNLQATSNTLVDIMTFGDLPAEALTVKGVIVEAYAFKGSYVAPTKLALGIDINGEGVEYSADKTLALAQGKVHNIWESRPGGGNFSVDDISDLSLYLKSAA